MNEAGSTPLHPRLLPFGDRAVLAEVRDGAEAIALYRALDAARPPGVLDLVPAARTVLVQLEPRILTMEAARRWIVASAANATATPQAAGAEHRIVVDYDGADLDHLAGALDLTSAELVAQHTGQDWVVAFGGFAPGFAYLSPTERWPEIPRLEVPRTAVPAGSVAVAGRYSGIYPRVSPGGWQLIGRTDAPLWDSARQPPALLQPGAIVRFEARG
ncbi:allophanate hydrolase subunit 1 [Microbacteriaceae bacterium VKM Ac-2855]|nr:allophanate hydrolase subunit 1 [Microbacteriaceae bacterium VKM Ac-2855]